MFLRRRLKYDSSLSALPSTVHEREHKYISRTRNWRPYLFCIGITMSVLVVMIRPSTFVMNLETPFRNPYWRAALFNPVRTLQARYWDDKPQQIKTFSLTPQNAFVLNMDRDYKRLQQFRSKNPEIIQRVAAHEWITLDKKNSSYNQTLSNATIWQQHYWELRYPWIQMASRIGKVGDAACSLSHVSLWKEKLLDAAGQDYLFVFEDDAILTESLTRNHTIQAPDNADIVLLTEGATKRVAIPFQSATVTRVIGGYGTLGYLITRQGALKMLDFLQRSREPVDLSFFEASVVKVYLPTSWPLVHHSGIQSSRININRKPTT